MSTIAGYTLGFAFPKPGPKIPRVVEKGRRYSQGKARLWLQQDKHCAGCPRWLRSPAEGHRHHIYGRGMGGGKRDDRDTELLCHRCHARAKILRRESWINVTPVESVTPAAEVPGRPVLVYSRGEAVHA
jgi:hypothetical protein